MLISLCALLFLFLAVPAVMAVFPSDGAVQSFAINYSAGDEVPVSLPAANVARLEPANALGSFDAVQSDGTAANAKFYALASHVWTEYFFECKFLNVEEPYSDIKITEVTWGNSWHPEATLVYLVGAYVRDASGNVVPYAGYDYANFNEPTYYAGVAWNKVGIQELSELIRDGVAQNHVLEGVQRFFPPNTFSQDGNFLNTGFHLPDEVVYASAVVFVDITSEVYDLAGTSRANTYSGNTDGYDLDAVQVYTFCGDWPSGDSATGMGTPILEKGTWFMYNTIADCDRSHHFFIQLGNPKNGENLIGFCPVTCNSYGCDVEYFITSPQVFIDGYVFTIHIVDEHLALSDTMDFTAKPGQDDNWDFGKGNPFPYDFCPAPLYIFAHWSIDYR